MRKTNLWTLLMALVMLFSMAACGEKGDDATNEAEGPKPPTTVDDNDWQTVASSGGTIEKDSISITFPSGTFSGDTKVAISNVSKGKILGDDEVSPFYQITMPVLSNRELTVKIKAAKHGEDFHVVIHTLGRALSTDETKYTDIPLESTYADGEYTFTLPTFQNESSAENFSFCLGLGHMMVDKDNYQSNVSTRAGGSVGNISWKIYLSSWDWFSSTGSKWPGGDIDNIISQALQQIKANGFWIDQKRTIPIYFRSVNEKGNFIQSPVTDLLNSIEIDINQNIKVVTWDDDAKHNLGAVIIHELLHYFQSDYDPKWWPAWKCTTDNYNMLYEAGAVWNEKFMNDRGEPSLNYINQYLPGFLRGGFDHQQEIYDDLWTTGKVNDESRTPIYASHGYGMAALFEYFSKLYGDKSIVDIYKIWKKTPFGDVSNTNTLDILKSYAKAKGSNLFEDDHYDDFILALAQQKVFTRYSPSSMMPYELSGRLQKKLNEDGTLEYSDKCYPYGCTPMICNMTQMSEKYRQKKGSFNDKQLKITQECDGVHTYVILLGSSNKRQLFSQRVTKGTPLIISGEELESTRSPETDDLTNTKVIIITTTDKNRDVMETKVSVTLEDAEKTENVTPFRTNFSLGVKYFEEVTRDGNTTTSETYNEELPFGFANINGYDKEITTTVDGTTLKVSCVNEERGMKETLSYDILNFNGNNMKVANLVYTLHSEGEHYVSGDGNVDVVRDYTIKIYGQLSFTRSNPGGGMQEYDFGLSETINSTNIYFEDKRINKRKWSEEVTSTVERKLVPNTTFNAYLSFEFYP